MLKKGTVVTIYEDPLTRIHPEGQAKIVAHELSLADGLEQYEVQFLDEPYRSTRSRKLIESVATETCSCREQPGDDLDCKVHARQSEWS